jgi:hypothetical protein
MNSLTRTIYQLAIAAMLLSVSAARAELVWEQKEVRLKAAPEDKEVVAQYRFKNEGTDTVKFKGFKSACGCISITSSLMDVPPGGQGEVSVKFVPEYRSACKSVRLS